MTWLPCYPDHVARQPGKTSKVQEYMQAQAAESTPADGVVPYNTPDPAAHAALVAAIPDLCEMMGVPPGMLTKRAAGVGPREVATLALRKLALGAIAHLGRRLGLRWAALYGEWAPAALVGVQRSTLGNFADQFAAWTGIDGYNGGKPTGYVAQCARARWEQVEAATQEKVRAARGKAAA